MSTCDFIVPIGSEIYDHDHFVRAIRRDVAVIVPNVDEQGRSALKFKSTGSLHGGNASAGARRSIRTSRFSGSFTEDASIVDDEDLMHPDEDTTIEELQVKWKVKRNRVEGTEAKDQLLGHGFEKLNKAGRSREQLNESSSDLDEPIILLKKKHKRRSGSSSSHLPCTKTENKDEGGLVSGASSLEDCQSVMDMYSINADLSETLTSQWRAPTETENSYSCFTSLTSGASDTSRHETSFRHYSVGLQPPCEVNTESSYSRYSIKEIETVFSPLSTNCEYTEKIDSPRKPSAGEPVSLLETSNGEVQVNSYEDSSSELSQGLPEISLIECHKDTPHESIDSTSQINAFEGNICSHLNQHDQQSKDLVAGQSTSNFLPEQHVLGKPYSMTADGRDEGESHDTAYFSNTSSDDVEEVCSLDSTPWSHLSTMEPVTEKSLLNLSSALTSHFNPESSTSELVGDLTIPDASLDTSESTYLQSTSPSVPIIMGNMTHLDKSVMNQIKPGPICQISAINSVDITDDMETESSGTLDSAPTEYADHWFPQHQHENDQSSADGTQLEYYQKYLHSCSSSSDMGSLSNNSSKREKHSSDHIFTLDTPNASSNKIRSKFSGIDGLEGRGPAWRQDLELTQAPKRFPSNRKTLSPMAKEKLHLEVNVEELYENMQHYRNRKRLWFDKCIDNLSTASVHKESLTVSSEKGAMKSKLATCQTKGILKPQNGTQENMRSSKETLVPIFCSQDAIKFSQRQMRDVEFITSKLLAELKSMKSIVTETLNSEAFSSTHFRSITDKMLLAQDSASAVESSTKKYLTMMNRDLKRFCKIMNSKEPGTTASPAATTSSPPKDRKITFADEAGGSLCNIKYFEEEPSDSSVVPESETATV